MFICCKTKIDMHSALAFGYIPLILCELLCNVVNAGP